MISESTMTLLVSMAAVGAGVMAGIYFVFSTFVMRALQELPQTQAAITMNSINRVILRSPFMPLFFGTTILYALLFVLALRMSDSAGSSILMIASFLYVGGMFLITLLFNVPLNNKLAKAEGNEDKLGKIWATYTLVWVRWNHVRTVCSFLSASLTIAYLLQG